jgi:hypothetical protein
MATPNLGNLILDFIPQSSAWAQDPWRTLGRKIEAALSVFMFAWEAQHCSDTHLSSV